MDGLCTVQMTRSGDVRRFIPGEGVDAERAERLLSGQVQALIRHVTGKMSLHASAAALGDRAVVLLGPSACGKSTLAADLCRSGFEMLADDAAFLEQREGGFFVMPSEEAHWLRDDAAEVFRATESHGAKHRLAPAAIAHDAAHLHLIVSLVFDESEAVPSLRRLDGHEAFRWLRTSLFRLVVDEPEVDANDFAMVAALYAGAPLFELKRRRFLGDLRRSSDLIREAVRCGGGQADAR